VIINYPSLGTWITATLLQCHSIKIRDSVASLLSSIANQGDAGVRILQLLLELLPTLGDNVDTSHQYFHLLRDIIEKRKPPLESGDLQNLAVKLGEMIKSHPIVETRRSKLSDIKLVGLLDLLRSIMKMIPHFKAEMAFQHELFQEIYEKCLFDIPDAGNHGAYAPPKCKTKQSRKSAFDLLFELTKNSLPVFQHLANKLYPNHESVERWGNSWNYIPTSHEKAESGYVGLRNLGATCYMNSLMQQLYMFLNSDTP